MNEIKKITKINLICGPDGVLVQFPCYEQLHSFKLAVNQLYGIKCIPRNKTSPEGA